LSRQSQALGSNRNSLYSLIADIKRTLESRNDGTQPTLVEFSPTTQSKMDNIVRSLDRLIDIKGVLDTTAVELEFIRRLLENSNVLSTLPDNRNSIQQLDIVLRSDGNGIDKLVELLDKLKNFNIDDETAQRQIVGLTEVARVVNTLSDVNINRDVQNNVSVLNDIIKNLSSIQIPSSDTKQKQNATDFGERITNIIKAINKIFEDDTFKNLANNIKSIEEIKHKNDRDTFGIGMIVGFLASLSAFIDNANVISKKKVNKGFNKVLVSMSSEIVDSLSKVAHNMGSAKNDILVVSEMFSGYASFVDTALKISDRSLVSLLLLHVKLKLSSSVFNKAFLELVTSIKDISIQMGTISAVTRSDYRQQINNIKETYSQFNDTIEAIGDVISIRSMIKTMLKLKAAKGTVDSVNKLLTEMFTVSIPPRDAMQDRLDYYIELATGLKLVFDELRLVNDAGIGRLDKSIKNLVGAVKGLDALDKVVGKKTGKNVGRFIRGFMHTLSTIDENAINNAEETSKTFALVVGVAVGALLVVSAASLLISWKAVVMFAAALPLFILGVSKAAAKMSGLDIDDRSMSAFTDFVLSSTIAMAVGSFLMRFVQLTDLTMFVGGLIAMTIGVGTAYRIISAIANADTIKNVEAFNQMVLMSGTVLVIGSYITQYTNKDGIYKFLGMLGGFTAGVSLIYLGLAKILKDDVLNVSEQFVVLVAVSGAIMFAGALVSKLIDPVGLITFTASLGAFLFAVSGIYILLSKKIGKEAVQIGRDFMVLLVVSGAILLGAGMLMPLVNKEGLITFTVTLGLFLLGVGLVYKIMGSVVDDALKHARDFTILIAVSGAVLLAGGAILEAMGPKGIAHVILFGVLLFGFVYGLTWIYKKNAKDITTAFGVATGLALLVAVSGAVLLAGGAILELMGKEGAWYTVLFGVMLLGFVAALTWIYKKNATDIAMSIPTALALGILVAISGAVLLAGGKVIADNKDMWWAVPEFAAITVLFVGGMSTVMYLLSQIKGNLVQGGLAMLAIAGITWLMGKALQEVALVARIASVDEVKQVMLIGGVLITGVTAIAAALGAIITSGVGALLLGAGAAALAGVIGFVFAISEMVRNVVVTATILNNAPEIDFDKVNGLVTGMFGIAKNMVEAAPWTLMVKAKLVSSTIMDLIGSLGTVAQVVKDLADLKIPIYNGTKLSGYITIGDETFATVASNIEKIITAVTRPLVDTIKKNPDLFGTGDFFSNPFVDTPAVAAAKMVGHVGNSLSKVAQGVKDLAELKIPVYNGTTLTKYVTLGNETFSKVSTNVKSLILAVARPIVSTIKDNPDLFKEGAFNDSPAVNAAKAVGEIGKTLTPLAQGVQFWSMLKVPVYEGEKIKEYITLGDDQFAQVAINIKRVIEAVGGALVTTVKNSTFIFGSWNGGLISSDAPALNASKSILLISNSLSPIAQCLAYYASGKFPIITGYDAHGKPIIDLSTTITQDTMKVAQQNIKDVLTAILDVLKDVQGDFGGDWFGSGSDVERASKAVTEVANSLKTMVDVVGNMSKTDFATVNAQVNTTQKNIKSLLEGVVSIFTLFNSTAKDAEGKDMTNGWLSRIWNGKNKTIEQFLNDTAGDIKSAIGGIVDASKEISKLFTEISDLQKTITDNQNSVTSFIKQTPVEKGSKEMQYVIVKNIGNILSTFTAIVSSIDKEELSSNASDIKTIAKDVDTFTDGFGDILKSLTKAMQSTNSFVSADRSALGNLQAVLNEYKNSMLKMVTVFKGIGSVSMRDIADTTMYQDRAFNLLIRTAQNASNAGGNGYSILAKGILEIAEAEAQLGQNQTFAQHAAVMERYVQTINAVKVGNLDRLNSFAISLNNLAEKLGNVDKLTHALAVHLTGVLNRLVKEIERAEKTINNADKMQVRRFDMIKKSVKDVQKIMDKKLVVEVNQGMAGDATLEGGGVDYGGTSNSSTTMNVSAPSGSSTDTTPTTNKANKKNGSIGLTELNEALSANNDVLVRKLKGRK
jgi:hypothetical protein